MKRTLIYTMLLIMAVLASAACTKTATDNQEKEEELPETFGPNFFGCNFMSSYYLWNKEIEDKLGTWTTGMDPISTVRKLRYKDNSGNDIDKWTIMTDKFSTFNKSVEGTSTTFGWSLAFYAVSSTSDEVLAIVCYTSKDSPAAKAGLKRGDCIVSVDSTPITKENFSDIANNKLYGSKKIGITLNTAKTVEITPVTMYEEPILLTTVFKEGGRKAGYMVFNSFTLDACPGLVQAGKEFRDAGVEDLILDLRYNSGGFVLTEELLASILAPKDAVDAGKVFQKEIYNSNLGENETKFTWKHTVNSKSIDTRESNIGIEKLYAIVTNNSASASESILTGLIPYMDVKLVGSRTYGKFCGGILKSCASWYEDFKDPIKKVNPEFYTTGKAQSADWGMYLMVSRYADVNGNTPSMPSGMEADIASDDKPYEVYQLGDPRENMLHTALEAAGYHIAGTSDMGMTKSGFRNTEPAELEYHSPEFGIFVTNRQFLR